MPSTDAEIFSALDGALATDDAPPLDDEAPWARATNFFVTGNARDQPSTLVSEHTRDGGARDLALARALALESVWGISACAIHDARRLAEGVDVLATPSARFLASFVASCVELVTNEPGGERDAEEDAVMRVGAPLARLRAQHDAVRALALLEWEALDDALKLARRASLRAQGDLRFSEAALCHLTLARLRRTDGRMHLASWIALSVLARISQPGRAWASYEAALSSGATAWPAGTEASGFGLAVRAAILAASRGDADDFRAARATLGEEIARAGWLAREADTAAALLGGDTDHAHAGAFIRLEADETLHGMHWMPPPVGRDEVLAWIRVDPDSPTRRVPAVAVGLDKSARLSTDGKGSRSAALVGALARGGGSLPLTELFRAVYGFEYDPTLHGGMVRVGLHRARAYIADAGRIERAGDEVRLTLDAPMLIPDVSVRARLADKVLQRLSATPGLGAGEIGESLGVPLRTVQRELETLVEEGSLRADRDGANIGYRVIDTVYSATGVRLDD